MDDTIDETATGPTRNTIRRRWDRTVEPSVAVLEAVATATGREITTLPTLQRTIDADAFDALLTAGTESSLRISFLYDDLTVVFGQDGAIEVFPSVSEDR